MTDQLVIRRALPSDAPNLVVLKQQVWVATYATEGIRLEFSEYLLNEFTLSNELDSLNDSGKITLLAESHNHLIACAVIVLQTKMPITPYELIPEISVLYVLERFTGLGIGKLLMSHTTNILKEHGFVKLFLTVYHENMRALNFYRIYGFEEVGITHFEMGGNRYENKVLVYLYC